jgi:hypothetical protein
MEAERRQPTDPAVRRERCPDFFIVGAPKCGTSAMNQYLGQHPDLYMAKKEMHFFGRDLHFGPQFYRRDRDAYLAEFNAWNGQAHAGEASVWYLFSEQAAAEIKAFNPEARIIIMLRDPVEMLYSLYYQFRADGNEHLPTFATALSAQEDRRASRNLGRRTYLCQGLVYDEVAGYTAQIRRYFEAFGRARVHVVIYDDFAAETDVVLKGVLDFLGVDSTRIGDSFRVVNGNKSAKSPLFQAILGDPLVRGTAIALRSWLPRPVFTALQKTESQLLKFNARPEKRPRLDPDLRASLKRQFQPEIERLSELLSRDLTHWTRDPALKPLVA